jgi:hypothetical protein
VLFPKVCCNSGLEALFVHMLDMPLHAYVHVLLNKRFGTTKDLIKASSARTLQNYWNWKSSHSLDSVHPATPCASRPLRPSIFLIILFGSTTLLTCSTEFRSFRNFRKLNPAVITIYSIFVGQQPLVPLFLLGPPFF